MTTTVHSWLKENPLMTEAIIGLAVGVVLLFLSPIFAPMVDSFWRFWRLPPQRLNIWILKARLASAEKKRIRLAWMRGDIRFLVFFCSRSLFFIGMALGFFLVAGGSFAVAHWERTLVMVPLAITIISLFTAYLLLLVAINLTKEISDAVFVPDRTKGELTRRVEELKQKLRVTSPP